MLFGTRECLFTFLIKKIFLLDFCINQAYDAYYEFHRKILT